MELSLAIVIAIIAVILSGLFSGSEIAFVQSSKVRMEIDGARGGMINRIIRGFSRHEDMFISTLLVGNNVVLVIYGIAFSAIVNPWLQTVFDNEALVLISNTLISTLIILICGEFMPKTTFRINPNFMIRVVALPLYLVYLLIYPISWFVSVLSNGLMRLFGLESAKYSGGHLTMEELDDYLQRSIDDGPSNEEVENEVKIFRRAIDFKDTPISKCMTPRNEITAVPIEGTTREKLLKVFVATGLSKIVVYREDIDDIEGYIHVSEMFTTTEGEWQSRIKPVLFTPETMLANKMMSRMLNEKKSLVIVVDEFGGTAGLVTLEDLVEEIFGEIEDEHDKKRVIGRKLPDGSYEFPGRMEISAIDENFGLHIKESEEYHTLAGYLIENLQALPRQGETFDIEGLRFTILRMSTTRIELVRVEKIEEGALKK
ncbi:MAG: HlyC/CorC family transporter [Bacteroidales bacterium]|nr:HlyC/CorC family transporter [Bacteroidales bacterium]